MPTQTIKAIKDGVVVECVMETDVLEQMMHEVRELNVAKEWFSRDRTFGDDVALLHSEVTEMLEAFRDYGTSQDLYRAPDGTFVADPVSPDGTYNKPISHEFEAADVLVRLLDTCYRYNIDLFKAWRTKVDFNWQRPVRHGGKNL